MAGAKETPRQRMISMMYLVLTALLALNVSNSVLEKFVLIDKSLENAISEKGRLNQGTISRIEKSVSESGNRGKDVAVLDKAKQVREETAKVLANLSTYRTLFIEKTGGLDANGKYKGQQDIDVVSQLMVKEGRGDKLKADINAYTSFLGDITGKDHFGDLALDAKDMDIFKNDHVQRTKTFAELHFGYNTPMVGALASISQMQAEILNAEGLALDDLAIQVGAGDLKFDQIVAMVRPESKTVASGASYKAEMFIAASASGIEPSMAVNGRQIPVVGGVGNLEFVASALPTMMMVFRSKVMKRPLRYLVRALGTRLL